MPMLSSPSVLCPIGKVAPGYVLTCGRPLVTSRIRPTMIISPTAPENR